MRRALIIGIDEYPDSPLNGCVADAQRMESVLSKHHDGSPNFDCKTITCPSDVLSRATLTQELGSLLGSPAEIAWFHFSGHGFVNDLGGSLVTPDVSTGEEGVLMSTMLAKANNSPVKEKIITLDCCYSGAAGSSAVLTGDQAVLSEGVSIITAARSNEPSLEVAGGGVFTSLLVEALEGGASNILGHTTAAGIYAFMDDALGAWDQRPLFKANVTTFARLRQAKPRIALDRLRDITKVFPLPAEDLQLDPSYEPSENPKSHDNEGSFRLLQSYRASGLVEPVGEEDMYYAAVNSKSCRLTKLGRYYWRLVDSNKI